MQSAIGACPLLTDTPPHLQTALADPAHFSAGNGGKSSEQLTMRAQTFEDDDLHALILGMRINTVNQQEIPSVPAGPKLSLFSRSERVFSSGFVFFQK